MRSLAAIRKSAASGPLNANPCRTTGITPAFVTTTCVPGLSEPTGTDPKASDTGLAVRSASSTPAPVRATGTGACALFDWIVKVSVTGPSTPGTNSRATSSSWPGGTLAGSGPASRKPEPVIEPLTSSWACPTFRTVTSCGALRALTVNVPKSSVGGNSSACAGTADLPD